MKKIIAMLLVLAMALSLVACGGGETASDGVVLDVVIAQYTDHTAEWWAEFETTFEAANEDIDLNIEVISWNDITAQISSRIQTGEQPDILNISPFSTYVGDDLLVPVDEYVSETVKNNIIPSFYEANTVDGTVWALPILASVRCMFVNTDIVEEIPTTWDEVMAACEDVKQNHPGITPWGLDISTDEGQAAFAYYSWNFGGGFVDENGEWVLNSAENVEAVNFIVSMINEGLTNTDPTTETRYALQDMFATGKVAMMIGPNQISKYCEQNGGINYGIASLPTNGDKAGASVGVMDRIMCFDNGYTDEELAAVTAVVDAFYDDEPYAEWVLMEDFLPATSTGNELCAAADPGMAA